MLHSPSLDKGRKATEQDVGDDAKGEDISCCATALVDEDLWGHEQGRASVTVHWRTSRHAKVCKLENTFVVIPGTHTHTNESASQATLHNHKKGQASKQAN